MPVTNVENDVSNNDVLLIDEQRRAIQRIFFPYAFEKLGKIKEDKDLRFVHYTSAEVAISIIRDGEMWLRNAKTMNDFSEVQHGLECLAAAYKGEAGKVLQAALNEFDPELKKEIEQLFNGWSPTFATDTYLTCVSEHSLSEDVNGRLSMWRAYAGSNGVALVINPGVFGLSTDVLNTYSSPVRYASAESFAQDMTQIGKTMMNELPYLKSLGRKIVHDTIFAMFHWAALCTKHPAFGEEKEWRVTHSPKLRASEHVKPQVKNIRGVPQLVYKLPLKNFPDDGLIGMEIPELLDHIIIGPTEFNTSIYDALVWELELRGIKDATKRVKYANIPLRSR